MAYDLRRIGTEKDIPPFKPVWTLWAALFVLIVGGGALGVLGFWPGDGSTHAAWFWVCVIVFPLLAWLVPFLFYLGFLQSRVWRAIEYNEDRNECIKNVQREAGVPLHVLASAFLFSTHDHENTPLAVTSKELQLEPRSRHPGGNQTVTARWIEPPGGAWCPGDEGAGAARCDEVLRYVLHSLIAQIAPAIRTLPAHIRVATTISVNAPFELPDIGTMWRETWNAHQLGSIGKTFVRAASPVLIDVDKWLDGDETFPYDVVTLLCTIQLNSLLGASPEPGTAEAGVILLLAPAQLVARKRLTSQALLHRPEQGSERDLAQALFQALLWSRTPGSALLDHWLTGGAQMPLQRALTDHLHAQGIAVAKTADLQGHHDLNLRIGDAGSASAWLNVALASTYACHCRRKQLISVTHDDAMTLAVITPRP